MSDIDWKRIAAAKDAHRDKVTAQPFDRKINLMERLRERTMALRGPAKARSNAGQFGSNLIVAEFHVQQGLRGFGVATVKQFGAASSLVNAIVPSQVAIPRDPRKAIPDPKP